MPPLIPGDDGLLVEIDGAPRRIADVSARPLIPAPAVTPVPLAPPALVGLAQVDGEVMPVLRPGNVRHHDCAILAETSLGRVLLLCERVLPDEVEDAQPLWVEPMVDKLRHTVRR